MNCALVVMLAESCAESCFHCGYSRRYTASPSPPLDAQLVADVLAMSGRHFIDRSAILTGGEPAASPDFVDMLALFGSSPLNRFSLATNGLPFLSDASLFDALARTPPDDVLLSLDGSAAEHDALRDHAGAYHGALDFLRRLRDELPQIRVELNLLVHAGNIDRTREIVDELLPLGIDAIRLNRYRPLESPTAISLAGVSSERWDRLLAEVVAPFNRASKVRLRNADRVDGLRRLARPDRIDFDLRPPNRLRLSVPKALEAEAAAIVTELERAACEIVPYSFE